MSRNILMSLNPQWFGPIVKEWKTYEVRKRVPHVQVNLHGGYPYTVYLYCTHNGREYYRNGIVGNFPAYKMNGTVCGEFTCTGVKVIHPPYGDKIAGTFLSAKEMYEYDAGAGLLYLMEISNPVLYEKPKKLEDFGLTRPPVSWCYVKEEKHG